MYQPLIEIYQPLIFFINGMLFDNYLLIVIVFSLILYKYFHNLFSQKFY